MPSPIGPDPTRSESFRHQQATGAAYQRGDAARAGRAATNSAGPQAVGDEESRQSADQGPAGERVAAPNGMVKETLPDGEIRVALPTGHLMVHQPGEEPWAMGPAGERV